MPCIEHTFALPNKVSVSHYEYAMWYNLGPFQMSLLTIIRKPNIPGNFCLVQDFSLPLSVSAAPANLRLKPEPVSAKMIAKPSVSPALANLQLKLKPVLAKMIAEPHHMSQAIYFSRLGQSRLVAS